MNRNVCFVGAEITPSEGRTFVGGSVNTVVGLCKGLSDLGWQVHLVTTPSRFLGNPNIDVSWAKIHIVNANGRHNSILYDFDFLGKAVREIERLNSKYCFDLVHGHSGYFGLSIIPILLRRKIGVPAFFSLYCPASMFPTALPTDHYAIKAMSFGLDKIVAVTHNVKRSLFDFGVDCGKIEVLPSCYDESCFNLDNVASAQNAHEPSTSILFVGNMHRTKGLDIFLSAAKSIVKTEPNVNFIVTLHEPDEVLAKVQTLVSRELGSSVRVLGVVEDMARLVASADVLVAPFRSTEGISDIPIIVLEAMAMGKPVVVSDLEGVKEAVVDGETGIIMSVNDSEQLVCALKKLLDDRSLMEKMGRKALSKVTQFSYFEISRRLISLYSRVVESC